MAFTLLIIAAICLAAWLYLASLGEYSSRRDRGSPSFALPPEGPETALDRMIPAAGAGTPRGNGLCLLSDNLAAFNTRLETLLEAGRSLDLQYYYWKGDITGQLLLREVVRAADRGVRVRLLLDDINAAGFDSTYLALDSHPLIEIRLFNPSRSRENRFRRGLELALKYVTSTRRMHNKCWIADGRIAIIGGRNIGDAYFNASNAMNFQDIDLLAIGPVVDEAAAIFDRYWNSEASLPIRSLHRIRKPRLDRLVARLEFSARQPPALTFMTISNALAGKETLTTRLSQLTWTGEAAVVADPPEKARGERRDLWIAHRLDAMLGAARSRVQITSPYFIPGRGGLAKLGRLTARGVTVEVLTNSLAATDVIAVHGAYSRYRRALLAAGVRLHELKPNLARVRASVFGSRTASLHTKSLVIDGEWGFVGSFNLDPRSVSINTEMGIIFRSAALAGELEDAFRRYAAPQNSYTISLDRRALVWSSLEDEGPARFSREPEASPARLLLAGLVRLLPIESQL